MKFHKRLRYITGALFLIGSFVIMPPPSVAAVAEDRIVYHANAGNNDPEVVSVKPDGSGRISYGSGVFPALSPNGPSITGKRTILPSVEAGDVLPGLITPAQPDKAKFAFTVAYNNQGEISNNSDLRFDYTTGTKCHNPAQAQNCHTLRLNAPNIAWLAISGENQSEGIFQGTANLTVDGTTTTNLFRVTALDGIRVNPAAADHFMLEIYAPGANPNADYPLYQVTQDVLRGNIKIRQ